MTVLLEKIDRALATPAELRSGALPIVLLYVVLFAADYLRGGWLIDPNGKPVFVDFICFWLGGRFALARDAAGVFDYAQFSAAQVPLLEPVHDPFLRWTYPPTFLLIMAPFALLPYGAAFLLWVAATLALCARAIWAILPRAVIMLLLLFCCPVPLAIWMGHQSFLLAALLGFSLAFIERRPFLAGLCLGLLTYKPQFGILFPLALLAAGQWRVIAGAVVSGALFVGAAIWAFGIDAWSDYAQSMRGADPHNFVTVPNLDVTLQTVFGIMHGFGATPAWCWGVHLAVVLPVALTVVLVWRLPVAFGLKAAALGTGALLVTPYMLAYDLTAIMVPLAFLIREGLRTGFLPGESKAIVIGIILLPITLMQPVGALLLLGMLILVLRRVLIEVPPAVWLPGILAPGRALG